jgi:hypothetical protein
MPQGVPDFDGDYTNRAAQTVRLPDTGQRLGCADAGFFAVFVSADRELRSRSACAPALPDDPLGDLLHRCEHAADPTRHGFIGDRSVSNGEVGLLKAVIADVLELEVVHPRGGGAVEKRINKRSDDVPDLREAFPRRLAHGRGMLVPERRPDTDRYRPGNSEAPTSLMRVRRSLLGSILRFHSVLPLSLITDPLPYPSSNPFWHDPLPHPR